MVLHLQQGLSGALVKVARSGSKQSTLQVMHLLQQLHVEGVHSTCYLCLAASEVRSILEDEGTSVSPESDDFWVLAAALKRFVDNEGKGCLPVQVSPQGQMLLALMLL